MEKSMRVNIKNNIKEVTKGLSKTHKEQIPFATSNAINMTLFQLRKEMGKQTTKHLDRPTPFTQKGFVVATAKKTTLKGILFLKDVVEKYLKFQIEGGTRSTGKNIPIPFKPNARLNKFGNIIGKRSGLVKKSNQYIGEVNGINGVWEKQKNGGNKLIIAFERSVNYRKRFPFYTIAEMFTKNVFDKNFTKAFLRAVRSSR
tara:strand:+ start:30 stop:632 length:603 start_codon:yes stop_codon:yes gene_type:complete